MAHYIGGTTGTMQPLDTMTPPPTFKLSVVQQKTPASCPAMTTGCHSLVTVSHGGWSVTTERVYV